MCQCVFSMWWLSIYLLSNHTFPLYITIIGALSMSRLAHIIVGCFYYDDHHIGLVIIIISYQYGSHYDYKQLRLVTTKGGKQYT